MIGWLNSGGLRERGRKEALVLLTGIWQVGITGIRVA